MVRAETPKDETLVFAVSSTVTRHSYYVEASYGGQYAIDARRPDGNQAAFRVLPTQTDCELFALWIIGVNQAAMDSI